MDWPRRPFGSSAAMGASVTRNPPRARGSSTVKTMAGKSPINKITLYFFVVEFTLMYGNLKRSGKTTCKRVSK